MMVGGALVAASGRGLERGPEVRGHAWAVVLQGMGLFVLDGVAWLGHRERMREFRGLLEGVELRMEPGEGGTSLGLCVPFGGGRGGLPGGVRGPR